MTKLNLLRSFGPASLLSINNNVPVKNDKQSEWLMSMSAIRSTTAVVVESRKILNSSRGVIFCYDIVNLKTDEILDEIRSQSVVDVRRITRRVDDENINYSYFDLKI